MTVFWAWIGLAIGTTVGAAVVWKLTRARRRLARASANAVRESSLAESRALTAAAELRTRERRAELEQESDGDLTRDRAELDDYAEEVDAREEVLAAREVDVEELQADVDAKKEGVRRAREEVNRLESEYEASRPVILAQLEERAGTTSGEVLDQLVSDRSDKAKHRAQMRLRQSEEEQSAEAASDATRLMAIAIDRYAGVSHLERIQNAIPILEARTLEAFVDSAGPAHTAFSEEIGCDLVCDLEAGTATVRGDDPLAREVARRVLRQISNRSVHEPDRIRSIAKQVKGEVDRAVQNAGGKAIRTLGLERVHPDILHLVGRLK
ncbi:MAG: Rnase Y domain-containing protein, partial [Myxococcota bacterium]